jgi:hypothetical protein
VHTFQINVFNLKSVHFVGSHCIVFLNNYSLKFWPKCLKVWTATYCLLTFDTITKSAVIPKPAFKFSKIKVRWNSAWTVGQMNILMFKLHYSCGPSNCFISIFWPGTLVFVHSSYYTEVAEWNKINSSRWNAEFV